MNEPPVDDPAVLFEIRVRIGRDRLGPFVVGFVVGVAVLAGALVGAGMIRP